MCGLAPDDCVGAGDGWYDVTIVSPRNFFVYTPLLPGAATGTVELRSITEAVRSLVAGAPLRWFQRLFITAARSRRAWQRS